MTGKVSPDELMKQAVDPTTLKKGDKITVEIVEIATWLSIRVEIRKCQFNVSTTTSDTGF